MTWSRERESVREKERVWESERKRVCVRERVREREKTLDPRNVNCDSAGVVSPRAIECLSFYVLSSFIFQNNFFLLLFCLTRISRNFLFCPSVLNFMSWTADPHCPCSLPVLLMAAIGNFKNFFDCQALLQMLFISSSGGPIDFCFIFTDNLHCQCSLPVIPITAIGI